MRSLTKRRLGILCAGLGMAGTAFGLAGGPASAAVGPDVEPILIPGASNNTCSDFAVSHGGGQTWLEVKFDPPNAGTQSGITITRDGNTFDWTSTIGIDAVYVKSGAEGSNLYVYAPTADSPESFGDDGLTSPQAISHISFCYDVTNPTTTTTEAETTTTTEAETTTTTEAETTTTTEAETTTTTEAETTTTTEAETTTTEPGEVLGTTATTAAPTTTAPTEVGGVQAEPLPRTGDDSATLLALSLGLLVSGLGLVLAGDGMRVLGIRRH